MSNYNCSPIFKQDPKINQASQQRKNESLEMPSPGHVGILGFFVRKQESQKNMRTQFQNLENHQQSCGPLKDFSGLLEKMTFNHTPQSVIIDKLPNLLKCQKINGAQQDKKREINEKERIQDLLAILQNIKKWHFLICKF